MTARDRDRLLTLLRERSWVKGPVVLSSGKSSNFYIDCKQTTFSSEGAFITGELVYAHIRELRSRGVVISAVGGITLGADPIAVAAAVASWRYREPVEAFTIRKDPKVHGTGQWIEGARRLRPETPVLIVEDVITTGASTLKAVERARDSGLKPVAVWAMVDRLEGGNEQVTQLGLHFFSLFTRDDFVDELRP